jgi:hypothetical protein
MAKGFDPGLPGKLLGWTYWFCVCVRACACVKRHEVTHRVGIAVLRSYDCKCRALGLVWHPLAAPHPSSLALTVPPLARIMQSAHSVR